MSNEADPVQLKAEAAPQKEAAEFQEAPGEAEAEAAREAYLQSPVADSSRLLPSLDPAARTQMIHRLQRERGNAYVQRVLAGERGAEGRLVGLSQPEMVDEVQQRKGGGSPLPEETRGQMEGFFGADLGNVRVHADGEAKALSRELNAQAFTVGSDVFFDEGKYDPSSREGQGLLAHELTHVGQQGGFAEGPVQRASRTGARVERPRLARAVQRFQAGIRGHGGIEQQGLAEAGFGGDMGHGQVGAIYFGNWLRDWSQVNPGTTSRWYPLTMNILNILSMGEFGRPLNPADLGGYLPSEHLDNPFGGKSAEDPTASPADRASSLATLSEAQRQALDRENTPAYKKKIEDASKASGLPDYIERGKDHSKQKLEDALREGKAPETRNEAMMDLGNALHAVEDYFAHSNFTEVALALLAKAGNKTAGKLLDKAKADEGFDAVAAGGKDPLGRGAGIITGTYGDESHSANKIVSLIEQLRSEVLTGALRDAFVIGSARVAGRKVAGIAKAGLGAEGAILGAGLGAVGGGVEGGVGGALTGVEKGYESGHGFWGTLGSMGSGLVSGAWNGLVSGGEHGAVTGAAVGERVGGEVGQVVGTAAGELIGAAEAEALLAAAGPLFAALQVAVVLDLDEKISKVETKKSAVGAPGGLPTHSQLAKDADEHPIFQAARALAVEADRIIGSSVRDAWNSPDPEKSIEPVTALVDKIVSYPTTDRWWQPILEGVVGR